MAEHGNSHENNADHHLYEIRDRPADDVYKFGICGKPLNADWSSPRAMEQVNFYNRAIGWACFFARVLLTGIPGRVAAKQREADFIEKYAAENGKRPPANPGKS